MPNKIIPFPYEIKITHSDFCYYGIYYSNKDRHSGSLFFILFFCLYYYDIKTHGAASKFSELTKTLKLFNESYS